jgi:hypothetical protein
MYTVGICVPTRQIRELSTFSVRISLKFSKSVWCAIFANDTCRLLDILVFACHRLFAVGKHFNKGSELK